MFTDMKGFTHKTFLTSRRQIAELLEIQDAIIRSSVRKFAGRVVKTMGDGHLIVFDSPTNAVLCGMDIQKKIGRHNQTTHPALHFELKIGINSGEVETKQNDVFGDAVNVASRIQGLAPAGGVYLTEPVYLSMNKNEIPLTLIGQKKVKGIPQKLKIYKVVNGDNRKTISRPIILGLPVAVLVITTAIYFGLDGRTGAKNAQEEIRTPATFGISVEGGYVSGAASESVEEAQESPRPSVAPSAAPVSSEKPKGKGRVR